MKLNLNELYSDIHFLAFHYHWSEKEIMEMPLSKRKKYVNLLRTELAGEGDRG